MQIYKFLNYLKQTYERYDLPGIRFKFVKHRKPIYPLHINFIAGPSLESAKSHWSLNSGCKIFFGPTKKISRNVAPIKSENNSCKTPIFYNKLLLFGR